MRLYFLIVCAAFVIAAGTGGVMSWDGSYMLFKILDMDQPHIAFGRISVIPAQLPVLLLKNWTLNIHLLAVALGLGYTVLFLAPLGMAWTMVRKEAPVLFVWATLGTSMGLLPGQFFLVSEALLAMYWAWPLLLGALVTVSRRSVFILVAISGVLFFMHPFAVALLSLVAVVAVLVGWRNPDQRRSKWTLGGAWAFMAALAALRFAFSQSDYEAQRLTWDSFVAAYNLSVAGLSFIALLFIYLGSAIVFLNPILKPVTTQKPPQILMAIELVCFLVAISALLVWASNPARWGAALAFRLLALFASLPFLGLVVVEGLRGVSKQRAPLSSEWPHRRRTIQLTGIAFACVLAIQTNSWLQLIGDTQRALSESQSACLSTADLSWANRTPLGHWSVTAFSLLVQGPAPTKLILPGKACSEVDFTDGLPLSNWDLRDWATGDYDLHMLEEQLRPARGDGS